jgi:hypothetical protein
MLERFGIYGAIVITTYGLGGIENIEFHKTEGNHTECKLNNHIIKIMNPEVNSDEILVEQAIREHYRYFTRKVPAHLVNKLLEHNILPRYNFVEFNKLISIQRPIATYIFDDFWRKYTPEQQNQLSFMGLKSVCFSPPTYLNIPDLDVIIVYMNVKK